LKEESWCYSIIVVVSEVYSFMTHIGKKREGTIKSKITIERKISVMLNELFSPSLFFFPMYWLIIIPLTEMIAEIIAEKNDANFPPRVVAATTVEPRLPSISVSTTEKDEARRL